MKQLHHLSILFVLFLFCAVNLLSAASSKNDKGNSRKRAREPNSSGSSSGDETASEVGETDASTSSSSCPTTSSLRVTSPLPGRPRVRRRVTFSPETVAETEYEINGQDAEINYFHALFRGKIGRADAMRRCGLILSPSTVTFQGVNKLLRAPGNVKMYLDELLKYQPHVFGQQYPSKWNVFQDANPIHIQTVLNALKSDHSVFMNVYKEHLRNPAIDFPDELYINSRPNRAIEMIELAEASGNEEEIRKCYLLPTSLLYYDLDGDTLFTKAVKTMNINRINWLFKRADAVPFMYAANYDEFNVFDLAMELFDEELDPDYSVFRCLLQVISVAYRTNKVDSFERIITIIMDHCREADMREVLLEALEEEFEAAKAYATANAVGDIQEEFIANIEENLKKIQNGIF